MARCSGSPQASRLRRATSIGQAHRLLGKGHTVGEPGDVDGVGHQHETVAGGRDREGQRFARHVHEVGDDADEHVWTRECGTADRRIARGDGALGVPQVGHHRGAGIEAGVCLGGDGIGVAERYHDAAPAQVLDQFDGTRQLGRQRHEPHESGSEPAIDERSIRMPEPVGAVRAFAHPREERSFEVHAADAGTGQAARVRLVRRAQGGGILVGVSGGDRGEERGDPVTRHR